MSNRRAPGQPWERRWQAVREIGPPPTPPDAVLAERERYAHDLEGFLRTAFPHHFTLPFSSAHLAAIEQITRVAVEGGRVAVILPRGFGKSTLLRDAVLWAALYGHRRFPVLAAATQELSNLALAAIKAELMNNEVLNRWFPDKLWAFRALENVPQRASGQTSGGQPTMVHWGIRSIAWPVQVQSPVGIWCTSVTASVRGVSLRGSVRPDLVLLDDPQTDETAVNPRSVLKLESFVERTLALLAGPGVRMAMFAAMTAIAPNDLTDRLRRSPHWTVVEQPALLGQPRELGLWERYLELRRENPDEAARFYQAHRAQLEAGVQAVWPHNHPADWPSAVAYLVGAMLENPAAFAAEFQGRPTASTDVTAVLPARTWVERQRSVPAMPPRVVAVDIQQRLLYWLGLSATQDGVVITAYGTEPEQGQCTFTAADPPRPFVTEPGEAINQPILDAIQRLLDRWPDAAFIIDAGWGLITRDLVAQFGQHPRVYLAQGSATVPKEPTARAGETVGVGWTMRAGKSRWLRFNPNVWKDHLLTVMTATPGSADCLLIDGSRHPLLVVHLESEHRDHQGRWKMRPAQENHWLDCLTMALVLLRGVLAQPTAPLRLSELAGKRKG